MSRHELKTWPNHFHDVLFGLKLYEYRKNDRGFAPGDILLLQEYNPDTQTYSGAAVEVRVDHVLYEAPGLPIGYCVMGFTWLAAITDHARKVELMGE